MDTASLIIPVFIAGILTFLAPCTLPLVPGYISFIGGSFLASSVDLQKRKSAKAKVFLNGLLYVIGFSAVFILLGSIFGLGGAALIKYRFLLLRVGGIFVILFGLFLLRPTLPFLNFLLAERRIPLLPRLVPGNPFSSFLFGVTFAFGWTPCIGPILGTVLTLAASSATVQTGAFLLMVFSLGLAIPFLATALALGWVSQRLAKVYRYLPFVSAAGGVFLILLGVMMFTDNFQAWIGFFYRLFNFIDYNALLDYL